MSRSWRFGGLGLLAVACAPILDDTTPYVTEPRVLAVRVEPAEVLAGTEVRLTALYADATGPLGEAPVDWSFCRTPRPLAELGPVASACLEDEVRAEETLGSGVAVTATVPADACSLFGPNPPPPIDGAPAGRPADPDVTGGFYQPAVAIASGSGSPTIVPVRVRCGLANVSQETYIAWNTDYRSNANPLVEQVVLTRDGADTVVPLDGSTVLTVQPGEEVTFTVGWPECPATAVCGDGVCSAGEGGEVCAEDCVTLAGCRGAETYVVYEQTTAALTSRREAISATWFATGGVLDLARNGRGGEDLVTSASNVWTAPDEAGEVWLAVVLRDERGGVDYAGFRVEVRD